MLRNELIEAVRQVTTALRETELGDLLDVSSRRSSRENALPQDLLRSLLSALKAYSLRAQNFNNAARHLTKIMEIDRLEDPRVWAEILAPAGNDKNIPISFRLTRAISFTLQQLPKIIALLERDQIISARKPGGDDGNNAESLNVISLVVVENDEHVSTVQRIVTALHSVELIYNACAVINNREVEKLSLITCDSGSDKIFDLVGASDIIVCVKELISEMYGNIVYFRERKLQMKQELAMRNISLLEKVHTLQETNTIGPEQAEVLKRQLVQGISGLIDTGVITTEIQARTQINPRQLVAPSPKLLSVSRVGETAQEHSVEGESIDEQMKSAQVSSATTNNGLTAEEAAILRRLVAKMHGQKDAANMDQENFGDDAE